MRSDRQPLIGSDDEFARQPLPFYCRLDVPTLPPQVVRLIQVEENTFRLVAPTGEVVGGAPLLLDFDEETGKARNVTAHKR